MMSPKAVSTLAGGDDLQSVSSLVDRHVDIKRSGRQRHGKIFVDVGFGGFLVGRSADRVGVGRGQRGAIHRSLHFGASLRHVQIFDRGARREETAVSRRGRRSAMTLPLEFFQKVPQQISSKTTSWRLLLRTCRAACHGPTACFARVSLMAPGCFASVKSKDPILSKSRISYCDWRFRWLAKRRSPAISGRAAKNNLCTD